MSRFLKVMIVLLAITAMAAPAVFAEDKLSLSGAFRVRGYYELNDGFAKDVDTSTFNQRMRIAGKIAVAEGVSLHFRTDLAEHTWGSSNGVRPSTGTSTIQVDRAYAQLKKNGMKFRAGQQNFLLGASNVVDQQGAGLYLNTGGAMPVTLFFSRQDDNNGASDANDDIFAANIGHKTDLYSGNLYAVYAADSDTGLGSVDAEVYLFGATASFNLDAAKITAELDYFDGEYESNMGDISGLQFYADASMAVSETATVGGLFYYAQGVDAADQAMGDEQVSVIGNEFNDWDPTGYGPFTTQLGNSRVFDFTGDHAGVIGGTLYAKIKASDDLTLTGTGSYLVPEEDDVLVTDIDSAWRLGAFAMYMIMPNTNVAAGVQHTVLDYNQPVAATVEEDNTIAAMRMQVKF